MSEYIWVVTNNTQNSGASRSYKNAPVNALKISTKLLEQNINQFLESINQLFSLSNLNSKDSSTEMQLDEIQLSIEIGGEGEVKLVGSGGKVTSQGGITLTFKRKKNN